MKKKMWHWLGKDHPDHASLLLLVSNGHEFPVSRPQLLQLVNGVPRGPTPFSQFSLFVSVCFFASAWPFLICVQFLVVASIKNNIFTDTRD